MQDLLVFLLLIFLLFLLVGKNFLKLYLCNLSFLMSLFMMSKMCSIFGICLYSSNVLFSGIDYFSSIMILFMFWLMGMSIMGKGDFDEFSLFLLYFLLVSVFVVFFTLSYLVFYIFYEASLIPIFLYILGWGFNYTRYYSGMYMIMYTLLFSLPMLLVLCCLFFMNGSLFLGYMLSLQVSVGLCEYIFFILGFMVKVPVYFFHVWLPKAHVESPCCGSMILAGILLKLGGYGLLRGMNIMLFKALKFNIYFIPFILMGSLISSFKCLFQKDLKLLVAYSSIVHMNLMVGGMMTMSLLGFKGSLMMMVGHGLGSSGLFYIVNVAYERLKSRIIYVVKGLINSMPMMSLWWFLMCSSNMSSPVSMNLLSEIFLINSLVSMDKFMILVLLLISFFSAFYSIYMFSVSQHGNLVGGGSIYSSGFMMEYLGVFFHWFPLNVLILNMGLFLYCSF